MFNIDSALREPWTRYLQRILVVDNDESTAASVRQFMESHFCTIDWAKDDSEALALMNETSLARAWDVIVADLRLILKPKSALLPLIQPGGEHLSIVLTCPLGHELGVSIVKARHMDLRVFLYKPFRAESFFDAVRQVIHIELHPE